MIKNVILYGIAIVLFILSCVFFSRAYEQIRWHASMTERSVEVYAAFQKLSTDVNNASVSHPELNRQNTFKGHLFFVDSSAVVAQLNLLRSLVRDSINVKIAELLNRKVRSQLSWMLASNVLDSIIQHRSLYHIIALKEIDALINKGKNRTKFLFQFRREKLESSLQNIQIQILVFLTSAFLLLLYVTFNLNNQYKKHLKKKAIIIAQEKRFKALVENSQDLIVMIDGNLRSLYRSPSAERITGYTNEERQLRNNVDQVHADDRDRIKGYIDRMKSSPGLVIPASYRVKHKEGHYIWLEGTFTSLLHDPDVNAIVVNMRDISRRMADEEELRNSEKRFHDTLENMMEGVQIIDFNWRYTYVNDALIRYSTYSKSDMIGRTVNELYPGVEQSALYAALKLCMEQRQAQQLESEFTFPNGIQKFFDLSIQPVPEGIFILSVDITERKKAEDELQKNIKELTDYKYALDEAAIVAITDQKGVIKHVNDNFCKISGYERNELIGRDHRIINSGFHAKEFIKTMWRTIASGQIWRGELKNRAKDGDIYWVDTTIVPFMDVAGKPYQYVAIRSDITDRKRSDQEVAKLNRLYAFLSAINQSIVHINDRGKLLQNTCEIAANIGDFQVAWIDMGGKIVAISGEEDGVAAIKRNEGRDFTKPVFCDTPVGLAILTEKYAVNNNLQEDPKLELLREGFVARNIHSSISFPIRVSGKMIGSFNLTSSQRDLFDAREIALLEEAAGDISFALENFDKARTHQITQELVVANERKFRALLEKSTDMKTLTSETGKFIYVSPSVLNTLGYHENELLGKPSFGFFHPEDQRELLQQRSDILKTPGAFFLFQYRVLHKAGHWIWCEGTLTNLLSEPDVNAFVSNFRDITERKNLEEQKEFDARNLAALINNTRDLLWSIDTNYRLITFNQPFFESIKVFSGKELNPGDNVFSVVLSKQQQKSFEGFYNRAFSGEAFTELNILEQPVEYISEISFYPIYHGDQVIGTACHSRNVTERKKAEREREVMVADLVQYTKNLEQFTFIVSHNLRAPIAHILGLANVLKNNLSKEDRNRSQAYLFTAADQLDAVINDLNKILEARSTAGLTREVIDLTEVLHGVKLDLSETLAKEQAIIETDLQVTQVHALKSYIYSIFLNLIGNSLKYRNPDISPLIRVSSCRKGNHIELCFSDNGIGMDLTQYGDKVFGMYQRFHLSASGKGLGLFMVKTHVEAMQGEIHVLSEPGKGTVFIISLPDV